VSCLTPINKTAQYVCHSGLDGMMHAQLGVQELRAAALGGSRYDS